ncbi:MAG: acyl-CoA dehydrogenase [Methyloligellaceae bacterium]
MSVFWFVAAIFVVAYIFMATRLPLIAWFVLVSVVTVLAQTGLYVPNADFAATLTGYAQNFGSVGQIIGFIPAAIFLLLSVGPLRRLIVSRPIFAIIKSILPTISQTEQEALDAGSVGWDAELFSGKPNWDRLREIPPVQLTEEEKAFIDGPTEELCGMIRDYDIRAGMNDIPQHLWDFVREKGFFGMLISKEHGGLGFSGQAQSIIVGKISACNADMGTVVMVPNSLGPGELIEKFGTDAQKEQYLERLAKGLEVPCFALTGPTSGSDATTMRDIGVICKGQHNGEEVLGIRLNWEKRYITLGPKATLLGMAFEAFDPDGLLGGEEKLGITCALIPTDHPGVQIGRRHQPIGNAFPNGPNWGKDVFIPIDWVIGGKERVGQGWRMLMSCLAVGRAISLPASGTAGVKKALRVTTAYARVRKQFGMPIGYMEGVQEPMARMAEGAYILEAARAATAEMVGVGEKPVVLSALLKYQSTEWARNILNDAMDIHGGKGVCDGPKNYLLGGYNAIPVGITVEGANILTRTLIVFAQGALRSHPHLYDEVQAVQNNNLKAFDKAFISHLGFLFSNITAGFFHNATGGLFIGKPKDTVGTGHGYKKLGRASRNFAFVADMTVGLLGGGLKIKQQLTGRLADALSELYFMSCILRRFENDGAPKSDRIIVEYALQNANYRFQEAIKGVIQNFPIAIMRPFMKLIVFPFGARAVPAPDADGQRIVRKLLVPGELRDNLTRFIFVSDDVTNASGLIEVTFRKVIEAADAEKKLERAIRKGVVRRYHGMDWIGDAVEKQVITEEEATLLREMNNLVDEAIAVDHFDPQEIVREQKTVESVSLNNVA